MGKKEVIKFYCGHLRPFFEFFSNLLLDGKRVYSVFGKAIKFMMYVFLIILFRSWRSGGDYEPLPAFGKTVNITKILQ
jgi:hypothetical protein